jgi:hypothetical protein
MIIHNAEVELRTITGYDTVKGILTGAAELSSFMMTVGLLVD